MGTDCKTPTAAKPSAYGYRRYSNTPNSPGAILKQMENIRAYLEVDAHCVPTPDFDATIACHEVKK